MCIGMYAPYTMPSRLNRRKHVRGPEPIEEKFKQFILYIIYDTTYLLCTLVTYF